MVEETAEEIIEEEIIEEEKPLYFIPFQENNLCGSCDVRVLHFNNGTNKATNYESFKTFIDKNGRVNLSLNKIKKLETIGTLPSSCPIRTMDLSYNGLIGIPLCISKLNDLEHLICSDNFIRILTEVYALRNLRSLDLSGNNIDFISPSFFNFHEIKYLDLSGNFNLEKIPMGIRNLKSLEELDISNTKLAENEEELIQLKEWLPNTIIYSKAKSRLGK